MNLENWMRKHNIDEAMRVFVDNTKNKKNHAFLAGLATKGYAIVKVTQDKYGNIHMESADNIEADSAKTIATLKRELNDAKAQVKEAKAEAKKAARKKKKKTPTATEIRKVSIA